MTIGYSTTSTRTDFTPFSSGVSITPGTYYFEARSATAPVTFTLSRDGTQVLSHTENGSPYDMNGGTTTNATGYNFTAGNYSLVVADKVSTITQVFSVGQGTQPIYGCTDPLANNYNPNATVNDGSCVYSTPTLPVVTANITYDPSQVTLNLTVNGVLK